MGILCIALCWIISAGPQTRAATPDHLRSSQVTEFFVAFLEKQLVDAADAMPANKILVCADGR